MFLFFSFCSPLKRNWWNEFLEIKKIYPEDMSLECLIFDIKCLSRYRNGAYLLAAGGFAGKAAWNPGMEFSAAFPDISSWDSGFR
jgi:hypothetical protein